jgi:hypothetical protein
LAILLSLGERASPTAQESKEYFEHGEMSSAEGGPLDAARATIHFEPAIESNGCSSKAEQSSSNEHVTTIDGTTITKATPDEFFDSVGDGLDTAAELARDPVVIASEQDNMCDKEVLTYFLPSP